MEGAANVTGQKRFVGDDFQSSHLPFVLVSVRRRLDSLRL